MTILILFLTLLSILALTTTLVAIGRDDATVTGPPRSHSADEFGTPLSS